VIRILLLISAFSANRPCHALYQHEDLYVLVPAIYAFPSLGSSSWAQDIPRSLICARPDDWESAARWRPCFGGGGCTGEQFAGDRDAILVRRSPRGGGRPAYGNGYWRRWQLRAILRRRIRTL